MSLTKDDRYPCVAGFPEPGHLPCDRFTYPASVGSTTCSHTGQYHTDAAEVSNRLPRARVSRGATTGTAGGAPGAATTGGANTGAALGAGIAGNAHFSRISAASFLRLIFFASQYFRNGTAVQISVGLAHVGSVW